MRLIHSPFFDIFPKVNYDVKRVNGSHPEKVPNIFFRIGFLKSTLAQTSSYDKYKLEDGDTPEIVAEKIYNDSGAGWMVLYANKILDPQFDWPLNDDEFEGYIIGKYGSVEKAQTGVHHYEKTITRENVTTGEKFVSTHTVSPIRYTDNLPNVPFDYWAWNQVPTLLPGNGTLLISADSEKTKADNFEFNITADIDALLLDGRLAQRSFEKQYSVNNEIFNEYSEGKSVSNYDYEFELNESKKFIRVIKVDYYNRIMNEFRFLSGNDSYDMSNRLLSGM
jgi:hypothetical protein